MDPTPDRNPAAPRAAPRPGGAALPSREAALGDLRRRLRLLEAPASEAGRAVALGVPALDRALPGGGLVLEALHELAPATPLDQPAALGFLVVLAGLAVAPGRPLVLALSRREGPERLDGHGLRGLGLAPERLVLVEAGDDRGVLRAMEEGLRSRAPGAVAGCLTDGLELTASRRLQLAAAGSGAMLLALRPAGGACANAAATRWRVGAAQGARDRFGCLAGPRWHLVLERCRAGNGGAWEVGFDHAAHRLGLA